MTEAIVVLLLSPLLFLGVAEWRDWQKECERTLHRAKNAEKMEECYVEIKENK